MKIHREGNLIIPVAGLLIGLLYLLLYWLIPYTVVHYILAAVAVVFFGLVVYFFRDPEIEVRPDEKNIIAPADGSVVVIEKTVEEEFLKDERIQISIFMSPLNVHVNRSPTEGKIAYFKYHPGKFLVAWHPKSSTENERTSIGLELANGTKILMRQIAGAVARRIAFYSKEGDLVTQGEKFGFIRFGSRIDLFLPTDAEVVAQIGDVTKGGTTIIARLP